MSDLWVAAWVDAMPGIDFEARRPWLATRFEERLALGGVVIEASDDDSAATEGFALVDIAAQDLDQVAVLPRCKGKGVGAALVGAAKRLCPLGLGLTVNQKNVRAIRLYEHHGFRVTGESVSSLSGLPIWRMRWEP